MNTLTMSNGHAHYRNDNSGSTMNSISNTNMNSTTSHPSSTTQQQQQQYPPNGNGNGPSIYAQSLAKSMTIDEMRTLHHQAMQDAEAKQTELRLVLASRYRELVGSSDEVLTMQRKAKELQSLVQELPSVVLKVTDVAVNANNKKSTVEESKVEEYLKKDAMTNNQSNREEEYLLQFRKELSTMPRRVHSYLDQKQVQGAALALVHILTNISSYTNEYALANALSNPSITPGYSSSRKDVRLDVKVQAQIKLMYLQLQTLPARTMKLAKDLLLQPSFSLSTTSSSTTTGIVTTTSPRSTISTTAMALNHPNEDGRHTMAGALSAMYLLHARNGNTELDTTSSIGGKLMDFYYDCKAKLIRELLNQMSFSDNGSKTMDGSTSNSSNTNGGGISSISGDNVNEATEKAEQILTKIILILQYDIILYPYQLFHLRQSKLHPTSADSVVMTHLPQFPLEQLQSKCSHFLASHLPLIRTKVKHILTKIAGTTASRLGQIRQLLYDTTDGVECLKVLDGNGICTWGEAVRNVVNMKIVMHGLDGIAQTFASTTTTTTTSTTATTSGDVEGLSSTTTTTTTSIRKFSLWSTLFSNTFSSLVHSLLSTSFHSVHTKVVATLRASLANAPPLEAILPHEAYRNTLCIATELDNSLKKVSDDAHELLVHAEEREESERRLRQSLYVQTCEIIGRLINELRRMLVGSTSNSGGSGGNNSKGEEEEATKELIVGRLCYLLKFRLTALPVLLDPTSSPASIGNMSGNSGSTSGGKRVGMITLEDLQSSFEIADDNDDGLISLQEAMDAMEGAFSGTRFHGAEMVRETMLLSSSGGSGASGAVTATTVDSEDRTVTFAELALLSARGLRHDDHGANSALGIIQTSFDEIIQTCFSKWAHTALYPSTKSFQSNVDLFKNVSLSVSDMEWNRLHGLDKREDSVGALATELGDVLAQNEEKDGGDDIDTDASKLRPSEMVGSVSNYVISYFLSATNILNQSICPSDSLPPIPSQQYANALGIDMTSKAKMGEGSGESNMTATLRSYLLQETMMNMVDSLSKEILLDGNGEEEEKREGMIDLEQIGLSALIQLDVDSSYIHHCLFERNQYGFLETNVANKDEEDYEEEESISKVSEKKQTLEQIMNKVKDAREKAGVSDEEDGYLTTLHNRHEYALASCDLFFSVLFGENTSKSSFSSSLVDDFSSVTFGSSGNDTSKTPQLVLNPLSSSTRFTLLTVHAERAETELQLLGSIGKKNTKEDEEMMETMNSASAAASAAVSSGFGFLSSMLKKK